ncbi:MAG TPA: alkaline phosphatase D family protein [Polyangiaceae bacterium]
MQRRTLLKAGALGIAGGQLSIGCAGSDAESRESGASFVHGVASGDPTSDSVLLWTRVTPRDPGPISGSYEVFDSLALEEPLAAGSFTTDADRDYTVKVDAQGLSPGTTYYYRFYCQGATSPVGRTRTAPRGEVERLRVVVFSCAAYAAGYFHAYRAAAARADVDLCVHLGDYIYEHGNAEFGATRAYDPPDEVLTLEDYRRRYAHYRLDPDLQAVHQQFPFVTIWDDHEVANDAWRGGAQNHQEAEGDYAERKHAAQQAYFEWVPVRETEPGQVHRSFAYGDLVDLVLLDTRHWGRDRQLAADDPALADEDRSILGADQEEWLEDTLIASEARWRLLCQQVMLTSLPLGISNNDAWEGYPASRQRLFDLIESRSLDNVVVLTGDIHMSWAFDVLPRDAEAYDPGTGAGSIAVEFVAPSVTSPSLGQGPAETLEEALRAVPHVRLAQLWKRGYLLLDVDHDRLQAEWYLFERVDAPADEEFYAALKVESGETFLREVAEAAPERGNAPALAPPTTAPEPSG